MAFGNAYHCKIVYESTETNTWTNDLHNNNTQYEKVLYFAKTELSHLDVAVDPKKIRNPDLSTESSDTEIEITNVVPAGKPKFSTFRDSFKLFQRAFRGGSIAFLELNLVRN